MKSKVAAGRTILETWGITPEYLTLVVSENPSLHGMILGYIAERKVREFFANDKRVSGLRKDDDHDRTKKGDLCLTYKGFEFKVEVKSLQTNSIKFFDNEAEIKMMGKTRINSTKEKPARYRYHLNDAFVQIPIHAREHGRYTGTIQCDASDKRNVPLPNGQIIQTTNLLVGEFDILAAGTFSFREKWDFGYALNRDLPISSHSKYGDYAKKFLLKTLIPITWPLEHPFVADPFILLDKLVAEKRRKKP